MDSIAQSSSSLSLAEHRRRRDAEDQRRLEAGKKAADTRALREKTHRDEARALVNLALEKIAPLAGPKSEVRLTDYGLLTSFGWSEYTYIDSAYETKNRKRRYGSLVIYLYTKTPTVALRQADALVQRLARVGVPASEYGWVNFGVPHTHSGSVGSAEVRAGKGGRRYDDADWTKGAHAQVVIDLDVLAKSVADELETVERGG